MCHRFSLGNKQYVKEKYTLLNPEILDNFNPNYNIAPSSYAPVILKNNKGYHVKLMKWGLVPSWAKDPSIGNGMANARIETLEIKPSFKNLLRNNRCIIPAEGFYEWLHKGKEKLPYFIYNQNSKLLSLAGLYETWKDAGGKELETFTIITTDSKGDISKIHERMPVVLNTKNEEEWLNKNDTPLETLNMNSQPLEIKPVSQKINSPQNDIKVY